MLYTALMTMDDLGEYSMVTARGMAFPLSSGWLHIQHFRENNLFTANPSHT